MKGTMAPVAWTFARSRALAECDRRYWYEAHLAGQGAADRASVASRMARRLSATWSFEELVADVVRRAILVDLLDHWEGRPGNPDIDAALENLRQYWRESRTRWERLEELADSPPPRRYRPIGELLYGEDPARPLREVADGVPAALSAWIESPARDAWLSTPRHSIAWLSDPAAGPPPDIAIGGGQVREAPLLVRSTDAGQLELGDLHWQPGDEPAPRGRRAVHALWAVHAMGLSPDHFAYRTLVVPSGREETGMIDATDVLAVREVVEREAETMIDHAGRADGAPREAAIRFARRDEAEVCGVCRFRRLCPGSDTEEPPWTE